MIKVPYGQNPYRVIGKYIRDHITAIEDIIAVIEIDDITTNQLFMVDMNEENYFIWENDWYEGGKDIALIDFFPVSEAINPSAQPEIIHCCDCIYYDPKHIEKNGVRYEYEDMPKDAFDIFGTGLVNSEYGINVGGRCCRDYNVGYSEDKRVFVSKQNYCGRAERRTDG